MSLLSLLVPPFLLQEVENRYYTTTYLWSVLPIAMVVVIALDETLLGWSSPLSGLLHR